MAELNNIMAELNNIMAELNNIMAELNNVMAGPDPAISYQPSEPLTRDHAPIRHVRA